MTTKTSISGYKINIGLGSCGIAAGADDVLAAFEDELSKQGVKTILGKTGCLGLCYREVLVDVINDGRKISYGNVTPAMVPRIVKEHLGENKPVTEWIALTDESEGAERDFLKDQRRIVLRNCGLIDPENIDDY